MRIKRKIIHLPEIKMDMPVPENPILWKKSQSEKDLDEQYERDLEMELEYGIQAY